MARTAADIISWNSVISRLGQKRLKHIKTICYAFVDFTETCFFMYLYFVSYLYIKIMWMFLVFNLHVFLIVLCMLYGSGKVGPFNWLGAYKVGRAQCKVNG